MKIACSEYNILIDTDNGAIEVVIENQKILSRLLRVLIEHADGPMIFSDGDKTYQSSKVVDTITSFVPFEINRKNLIGKLAENLIKSSVNEINCEKTIHILQSIEKYAYEISEDLTGSIVFKNIDIEKIIKSIGPCFEDEYECIGEKLQDYFELVREYEGEKLFVLYNLRSLMTDEELDLFIETSNLKNINLVLLESSERKLIKGLKRYIMDESFSWIS